MSDEEVLNQDEIDALLGGDEESGEVKEVGDPSQPRVYDFSHEDRVIRSKMPNLETINQRFIRNFRIQLYNFLRKTPEVTYKGIETYKYSDYLDSLSLPISFNLIKMPPLKGSALLVFDSNLVYSLVECLYGGDGKQHTKIEGREFSPTEDRMVHILMDIIFKEMKECWGSVLPIDFEYKNTEVNPAMANFVQGSDIVVSSQFNVELESGGGAFHLTIPYMAMEPVKEVLTSNVRTEKDDSNDRWVHAIQQQVLNAEVEMNCILAKKEIKLRDVLHFEQGTFIPIELPEYPTLLAEGIKIFKSKFGVHEGKYALKVLDKKDKEED